MTRTLVAAICVLVLGSSWAAPPQVKVTGTFSNLHYVPEAGDLVGAEISIVVGGPLRYFAILQCAEGGPSKPVVVPATSRGPSVELGAHNDSESHCPAATYRGTISASGLRGAFEGTQYPGFLKRTRGHWQ